MSEEIKKQITIAQLTFEEHFKNLCLHVQKLNMPGNIKTFALMNLDQGGYWAREGLSAMMRSFLQQQEALQKKSEEENKKEDSETKQEEKPQE